MSENHLLTTEQAAEILNLQPGTLSRWRYLGKGPPWIRVSGRTVRYRRSELELWIAELPVTTAEATS